MGEFLQQSNHMDFQVFEYTCFGVFECEGKPGQESREMFGAPVGAHIDVALQEMMTISSAEARGKSHIMFGFYGNLMVW